MKISTQLAYAGDIIEGVKEVQELERAGLDTVWVAEAYGFDAVSLMGYLAAKTERVQIASGILPIFTRTPTLLAMTAAGVDALSNGRCMLGLGASGPQVIEGFHGVPYEGTLTRTREIVEICRAVWRRERVVFQGQRYTVPLPHEQGTGLGKPLKLINHPVRDEIPIAIAALGKKSVELTAELADGWLPVMFVAGEAHRIWGDALAAGGARRDPARPPLEIYAGGAVAIGEGLEALRDLGRPMSALYIGGMGARGKNFYNDVFAQYGYEAEAKRIQDLYLAGKKADAAAAIPAKFIEDTTLVGPEGFVRERIVALKESGVNCLNVGLAGRSRAERVQIMDRLRNLVDSL